MCQSYLLLSVLSTHVIFQSESEKHKGESKQRYGLCVPPCPRYITDGDTHSLCVVCLDKPRINMDLNTELYFHVSILLQQRKFLRFTFGGEAYQYRVLLFGLALSLCTFTKCVDAALAPLRLQGIRILNYINDLLIFAQSEQVAVRHRDVVLAHMKELRLGRNGRKVCFLHYREPLI